MFHVLFTFSNDAKEAILVLNFAVFFRSNKTAKSSDFLLKPKHAYATVRPNLMDASEARSPGGDRRRVSLLGSWSPSTSFEYEDLRDGESLAR